MEDLRTELSAVLRKKRALETDLRGVQSENADLKVQLFFLKPKPKSCSPEQHRDCGAAAVGQVICECPWCRAKRAELSPCAECRGTGVTHYKGIHEWCRQCMPNGML
jgi:hypothetical protein